MLGGVVAAYVYLESPNVAAALFLIAALSGFVAIGCLGGCLFSWFDFATMPEKMKALFVCERWYKARSTPFQHAHRWLAVE